MISEYESTIVNWAYFAMVFVIPIIGLLVCRKINKKHYSYAIIGALVYLLFAWLHKFVVMDFLRSFEQVRSVIYSNISANALLIGVLAGVFEETGKLIVFQTFLRRKKDRDLPIIYGIGHGVIEEAATIAFIFIAIALNSIFVYTFVKEEGSISFNIDTHYFLYNMVESQSIDGLGAVLIDRTAVFLFSMGATILVFYACKYRTLIPYLIAIVLHTAMVFTNELAVSNILKLSTLEYLCIIVAFGVLTFGVAYTMFWSKDDDVSPNEPEDEIEVETEVEIENEMVNEANTEPKKEPKEKSNFTVFSGPIPKD